jgi:hypothetical protein
MSRRSCKRAYFLEPPSPMAIYVGKPACRFGAKGYDLNVVPCIYSMMCCMCSWQNSRASNATVMWLACHKPKSSVVALRKARPQCLAQEGK